jgi:DNA-binding PadR family transcriptional regulator
MRRPLDTARPARYALLGLLLDGPRHGYDLLRAFGPSTPLGSTIHLGTSHLYALLARLEQDGLIAGEDQPQEGHPPRRVFRLTEEGRAAVVRWLEETVARPRDVLLDFPIKLYLAHHRDPAQAARLIGRQRAQFAEYLASLEREEPPPRRIASSSHSCARGASPARRPPWPGSTAAPPCSPSRHLSGSRPGHRPG